MKDIHELWRSMLCYGAAQHAKCDTGLEPIVAKGKKAIFAAVRLNER